MARRAGKPREAKGVVPRGRRGITGWENTGWGQRVELGPGKGNPWKFPIETGTARPKESRKGAAQRGAAQCVSSGGYL